MLIKHPLQERIKESEQLLTKESLDQAYFYVKRIGKCVLGANNLSGFVKHNKKRDLGFIPKSLFLKSFIKIKGEKSGEVTGKTIVSSDKRTIIFKPSMPFIPGEKVKVHLTPRTEKEKNNSIDITYYYTISPMTEIPQIQSNNDESAN